MTPQRDADDERSGEPAAKGAGALLGGLVGLVLGPIGAVVGGVVGVGVEEGVKTLLGHRLMRAKELGAAVEERGVDISALEHMLTDPLTAILVAKAASTAAETTSRLHIEGLAAALAKAAQPLETKPTSTSQM